MKFKVDRIISMATLVASLVAIVLVVKKPAPPHFPEAPSVNQKPAQSAPGTQQPPIYQSPAAPQASESVPSEAASSAQSKAASLSSADINAALAQSLAAGTSGLTLDTNVGSGEPSIKDQQVTYDGEIVHGKFLTTIAGKDVWVTVSGKMGEKDGYATFDPSEFKVGDMNVPVSLVNPALQKKMAEERDRLKIPDNGPH